MPYHRSYNQEPFPRRLELVGNACTAYDESETFRTRLQHGKVTPAYIDDLRALRATAVAADEAQVAAYAAADRAKPARDAAMAQAEAAFDEVWKRAKNAARLDPELKAALRIEPEEQNRTKRLRQIARSLDLAEANRDALAAYGVTDEHYPAARAAHEAAEKAVERWDRRTVEAEHATAVRDEKLEAMDVVMRDLQERGKVELAGEPQLLELLGLRPQ